jgi:hypothetical protein
MCRLSLTWMFNKPATEASLLNKSLYFFGLLGVTKLINVRGIILVTLMCRLSPTWIFNKSATQAGLLNKSSCLAPALGVHKFIIVIGMILVTLFCGILVRFGCSTN